MAISGQAVLAVLRAGYESLENASRAARQRLAQQDGQLREALNQLQQSFKELAEHYLPELSRPAIEGTFSEVRQELLELLAQQQQTQRDVQLRHQDLQGELHKRQSDLDDITTRLNEKVRQREQLEVEVTKRLADDPDFQQLSTQLAQAEERLAQNECRLKEVEQNAAEKLPAYKSSRLFTYLNQRKFGTPDYRGSGLFGRLDRWVAELIDYPRHRRSFEFLSVTPKLMAEELARRHEAFDKLMDQVQSRQKAAADEAGLTSVLAEGYALGQERDQVVAEIAETGQQIRDAEARLAELSGRQSEFYQRGVGQLREFLGRAETAVLEQRARQTWDPDDDPLVAEIVANTESVQKLETELRRQRQAVAAADEKSASLQSLVERFQQSNFDAERSVFGDNLHPEKLLTQYADDQINAEQLWRELAASQMFRPMRQAPPQRDDGMSTDAAVILGALIDAVGGAMEQSARRGVQRHWPQAGSGGSRPSFPASPPRPSPGPRPGPRGFTTGDGF